MRAAALELDLRCHGPSTADGTLSTSGAAAAVGVPPSTPIRPGKEGRRERGGEESAEEISWRYFPSCVEPRQLGYRRPPIEQLHNLARRETIH